VALKSAGALPWQSRRPTAPYIRRPYVRLGGQRMDLLLGGETPHMALLTFYSLSLRPRRAATDANALHGGLRQWLTSVLSSCASYTRLTILGERSHKRAYRRSRRVLGEDRSCET
jgi:hypothetical protein